MRLISIKYTKRPRMFLIQRRPPNTLCNSLKSIHRRNVLIYNKDCGANIRVNLVVGLGGVRCSEWILGDDVNQFHSHSKKYSSPSNLPSQASGFFISKSQIQTPEFPVVNNQLFFDPQTEQRILCVIIQ